MLIKLTLPTLLDLDGGRIKLKPGVNEVDQRAFERVAKTRPVEHYLKSGALVVIDEGRKAEHPRKVQEVIALVGETTDVELLRRWGDEDNRPAVQEAVRRRLAELKPEV